MLQPKKTKFRRQQKGRMKGEAQRGNQLAFGSFGIKALENKWITGRQIEAARIAVTRYMQRQGQVWVRIFPDKLLLNLLRRTFACLQLDKKTGIIQVGQQVNRQLVIGNLAQQQDRQYQHTNCDRIAYRKFDNTFHF